MTIWTHEVPMRWADIDMLQHVNNVAYLDYAAEAQARLAADGLAPQEDPTAVTVTFLRPVFPSQHPLTVTSRIDDGVLTQEIRASADQDVAARVISSWKQQSASPVPEGAAGPLGLSVRVGDLDGRGHVSTAKLFELSQEGRVGLITRELNGDSFGKFVVGTVELQVNDVVPWRVEPYRAYGWVSRVGQGSFTIHTVIADGDRPLITSSSILVGFDMNSQSSRRFTDAERAMVSKLLS